MIIFKQMLKPLPSPPEQTVPEDLQAYVKDPLAILPLTQDIKSSDKTANGGLRTKERRVGYDSEWMEPLGARFEMRPIDF